MSLHTALFRCSAARLDLTVYPYLPRASVATTSAKAYLDLLAGVGS